jgi:hypothetical protein
LAGYDASTFNSIQGFGTFINHFKEPGDDEIKPTILGGINTGKCSYDLFSPWQC